jgi:hypothetical protein
MQAFIETRRDGSVDVHLDIEAARAVFASVVFASRFHEALAPMARIAEERLGDAGHRPTRRGTELCQ